MSSASRKRAEEFLKISSQFQLGALTTEASHPATANLSEIASTSIPSALRLLFNVDEDVLKMYSHFVQSGRAHSIAVSILSALETGGKIFFTGCGSTGRLSIQLVSIWKDFWQTQHAHGPAAQDFENRALSVMAGGDFALIKAVEGFEDFVAFGKKQIGDMGLCSKDVVFAITEGGETSFVIGTAWKGIELGAKVYFVYNNPDEVLCRTVERSRAIIEDSRIEKINLTTGPMAITGSTRMQATTIQLCVLLTVLEIVIQKLMEKLEPGTAAARSTAELPETFLKKLEVLHKTLNSESILEALSNLVRFEEDIYRSRHKTNYFADRFGIDVLTDTTERSPTYCTPPFRKAGDSTATESWAFLFLPYAETEQAWARLLKRTPSCIEWTEPEIRALVDDSKYQRTCEIVKRISSLELMRFKVGLDGESGRLLQQKDGAIVVMCDEELDSLLTPTGFYRRQLEKARAARAHTAVVCVGSEASCTAIKEFLASWDPECVAVLLPAPKTDFLLNGVTRAGLKMLLNALSTCTMVRLGRVMGNFMIWVVPSNLKLIDRSTRYIQKLTDLDYHDSNQLLFEVIEYIEPRMKADQAYPPAVGLAVLRARLGLSNEKAEQHLAQGSSLG
jgi:N-acetylmuramic acid 6-phosphate etherase